MGTEPTKTAFKFGSDPDYAKLREQAPLGASDEDTQDERRLMAVLHQHTVAFSPEAMPIAFRMPADWTASACAKPTRCTRLSPRVPPPPGDPGDARPLELVISLLPRKDYRAPRPKSVFDGTPIREAVTPITLDGVKGTRFEHTQPGLEGAATEVVRIEVQLGDDTVVLDFSYTLNTAGAGAEPKRARALERSQIVQVLESLRWMKPD